MINLLGKLHPLIVHLPIGILLLNVGLIFITRNKKYAAAKSILPLTLLIGAVSAVAACITGLLLSQSGDYNIGTLNYHKWLGIVVALLALGIYFLKLQENRIIGIILALLLTITGHFGGTLTHGENYLASPNPSQGGARTPYAGNIQEALIYKDLVRTILQEKCVSCHNANKQKGRLRLDEPDFILKGGKNGAVVVAGEVEASELIKRLLLDLNEEHHMPPKGKPQPTEAEIELLKWWIAEGCSFDKKVAEVTQNEEIKTILANYDKNENLPKVNEFVPTASIKKADQALLDSLNELSIIALPIEPNSPFLSVNFISLPEANDSLVQLLVPVSQQIAWLKLSGTKISNNALQMIAQMPHLTRLSLNDTPIDDLSALSNLKALRYLNVVGTNISLQDLNALKGLKYLQQIYLFNTNITRTDSMQIQQFLPNTQLDFGDYQVATLASDTSIFKIKR